MKMLETRAVCIFCSTVTGLACFALPFMVMAASAGI
jgi:hypothetical protein